MRKFLFVLGIGLLLSTTNVVAATAATVNGMKITVKDANKALKVLTKGKMTWAKLPKSGKKQLIEMMAPSKLVAVAAKRGLTSKEKEIAVSGYWMQKKTARIKISDSEAKKAYNQMKRVAKKMKSRRKIPSFQQAKPNLKRQLAQEKVINSLMRKAKIKIK